MDESQRARAYTCMSLCRTYLKVTGGFVVICMARALIGLPPAGEVDVGIVVTLLGCALIARVEAGTYGYGRRDRG